MRTFSRLFLPARRGVTFAACLLMACGVLVPASASAAATKISPDLPQVTRDFYLDGAWQLHIVAKAHFDPSTSMAEADLYLTGGPLPPLGQAQFPPGGSDATASFIVKLAPGHYTAKVVWSGSGLAYTGLQVPSPTVAFDVPPEPCFAMAPVPVQMPGVDVSYSGTTAKPFGIKYETFPLTFTPAIPPGGVACRFTSTGTLPVTIDLKTPGKVIDVHVDSVATATLDFLDSAPNVPECDWQIATTDCFVGGTGDTAVRWHTDGFSEQITPPGAGQPVEVYNSGPLTFYAHVPSQLASDPGAYYTQAVQNVEALFHTVLIAHLGDIRSWYAIQDPPAALTVTDSDGRVTGVTATGTVREIPGSYYVSGPDGYSAVLLFAPTGRYTVGLSGAPGSTANLVMTAVPAGTANAAGARTQALTTSLGQDGTSSVCFAPGSSQPTGQSASGPCGSLPEVTGVAPATGSAAGGDHVVISGHDLAGVTAVRFGTVASADVACTAMSCTAVAPPGSGTVDVTVSGPSGTSPRTPKDAYAYAAATDTGSTGLPAGTLVTTGGFEPPDTIRVDSYQTLTPADSAKLGPWRITAGSVDLVGPSSAHAAEGAQFVDLDGNDDIGSGAITQTIATKPGHQYRVAFYLAGNPNGDPPTKTLDVAFGSTQRHYRFDVGANTNDELGWTRDDFAAVACGRSTALTFTSTTDGERGPLLDAVSVLDEGPSTGTCPGTPTHSGSSSAATDPATGPATPSATPSAGPPAVAASAAATPRPQPSAAHPAAQSVQHADAVQPTALASTGADIRDAIVLAVLALLLGSAAVLFAARRSPRRRHR